MKKLAQDQLEDAAIADAPHFGSVSCASCCMTNRSIAWNALVKIPRGAIFGRALIRSFCCRAGVPLVAVELFAANVVVVDAGAIQHLSGMQGSEFRDEKSKEALARQKTYAAIPQNNAAEDPELGGGQSMKHAARQPHRGLYETVNAGLSEAITRKLSVKDDMGSHAASAATRRIVSRASASGSESVFAEKHR